ncbi:hypothetical protein D3C80_1898910 [compost metagenome]
MGNACRETWVTGGWSCWALPEIKLAHDLVDEYHLEDAIRRRRAEGNPLACQASADKQAAALEVDLAEAPHLAHLIAGIVVDLR